MLKKTQTRDKPNQRIHGYARKKMSKAHVYNKPSNIHCTFSFKLEKSFNFQMLLSSFVFEI